MIHTLEPCCYLKQLYEWYTDEGKVGRSFLTLLSNGDVTLPNLISWCVNMCLGDKTGAEIYLCMPFIMDSTSRFLSSMSGVSNIALFTCNSLLHTGRAKAVFINDIHTQVCIVRGGGHQFLLTGQLLQAVSPGKYLLRMDFSEEACEDVLQQLRSWSRVYGK